MKTPLPSGSSKHSVKSIALIILALELVFVSLSLYESILTWILLLVGCGAVSILQKSTLYSYT